MKKIIKWIAIIIVLVVVGAVGLVYLNIDSIIKSTVESQGTQQLNVTTTLGGVSISLLNGTVDLSNLGIGSPQGFSAPQMLSLGGLAVDTGGILQLRNEPIHVASIRIDQPKLVIEQADGKLNFKALMDGLPKNPDQNPVPAAPPSSPATPGSIEQKPGVKLIIDDLQLNNAQVELHAGIPGLKDNYSIAIPSIDMKNIGNADGAKNGAAIKDVVTAVITQLTSKAADSGKLPPEVSALLTGNLAAVEDKLTTAAQKKATAEVGKLTKKLSPALGGATNELVNQGFGILRQATSQPAKK